MSDELALMRVFFSVRMVHGFLMTKKKQVCLCPSAVSKVGTCELPIMNKQAHNVECNFGRSSSKFRWESA